MTGPLGRLLIVQTLLLSFFVSVLVTAWVVHVAQGNAHFVLDHDVSGPQKFHVRPVPRVGGVGIVSGIAVSALFLAWADAASFQVLGLLLLCAIPAFGAGLIEDLTKRISPAQRLSATAVSASIAFWSLSAQIRRSDIPGLDDVLVFGAVSLLVTLVAVAGIANSVNIIDGFNGLASMCAMIMMAALAYVAYQTGDQVIGVLALAGLGAVLGFFIWNFPGGLIFLGDGGAYFLGFYVAELSILLLVRNPEVSPLFPLLVCVYPVFETLFSMYRRRYLRAVPASMPDGIHLHSLIYRRVLRWAVGDRSAKALTRRNSMTSPFLWMLCMLSVVPAVLFYRHTSVMAASLVLFGFSYIALYWRIVRFKAPRWLRLMASPARSRRGRT